MKRRIFLPAVCSFILPALLILLLSTPLYSREATLEMAGQVGAAHFLAQREFSRQPDERSRKLKAGEEYTAARIDPLEDPGTGRVLAYIIHLNPQGYIAVSVDTDITPVIAYSYRSDFVMEDSPRNIPLHMITWDMQGRLAAIPLLSQDFRRRNNEMWEKYLEEDPSFLSGRGRLATWGYWIDTTWNQGGIYNDKCPLDPENSNRCITGCVATAMAQIVNYWEFPNSMSFSSPADDYVSTYTEPSIDIDADAAVYDFPSFTTLSASLSNINYNGSSPHPTNETIANLMFACGVSVKMNYSSSSSGAPHSRAFVTKFGYYSADIKSPSDTDFYTVLESNMKSGYPAQLGISESGQSGGHSIVCDGYRDDDNFYHLNYGWGGSSDGWYSLPGGMPAGYDTIGSSILNIDAIPPPPTPTPTPSVMEYISAFKENRGSLVLDLYRKPEPGDWTYWDAHARNPSTLLTDTAAIPGGEVVAATDVDIDGDGKSEIAVLKRETGWDLNLYLYDGPRPPGQSNKFPVAYDFWIIPQGNNILFMANAGDVNGDGREDIAVMRKEAGIDYNLYIYNSPARGDFTYDAAWSRNIVPIAHDKWFIPQGNDAVALAGVDLDGDFSNDGLAAMRNQSGDYNLYIWKIPEPGDWFYSQAEARQNGYGGPGTPQARDFWLIPAGNNIVAMAPVQYRAAPEAKIAVIKNQGGDQNLYLYNLPKCPDRTYYDAVVRNPTPLARDFWIIPAGNHIVDTLGTN